MEFWGNDGGQNLLTKICFYLVQSSWYNCIKYMDCASSNWQQPSDICHESCIISTICIGSEMLIDSTRLDKYRFDAACLMSSQMTCRVKMSMSFVGDVVFILFLLLFLLLMSVPMPAPPRPAPPCCSSHFRP